MSARRAGWLAIACAGAVVAFIALALHTHYAPDALIAWNASLLALYGVYAFCRLYVEARRAERLRGRAKSFYAPRSSGAGGRR